MNRLLQVKFSLTHKSLSPLKALLSIDFTNFTVERWRGREEEKGERGRGRDRMRKRKTNWHPIVVVLVVNVE